MDGRVYQQWDIWQVNWVHEDGQIKDRPALLLTDSALNASRETLLFAKITGTLGEAELRFTLDWQDPERAENGLSKTSHVYLANQQEVEKRAVLYRRGRLGPQQAERLKAMLESKLGRLRRKPQGG